jgi:leucyl aminopeptidase
LHGQIALSNLIPSWNDWQAAQPYHQETTVDPSPPNLYIAPSKTIHPTEKGKTEMIKLTTLSIERSTVALLAVPVCKDAGIHSQPRIKRLISNATRLAEFSGKDNEQILLYEPPETKVERCLFIGMGDKEKIDMENLRRFAGQAVRKAIQVKLKKVVIVLPDGASVGADAGDVLRAIAEGAGLANHKFDKYKENSKDQCLKEIVLVLPARATQKERTLVRQVKTVTQATLLARQWVNTPANDKVPVQFAEMISAGARDTGLRIKVMGEAQLKKQRFGALLSVSAGSSNPAKLVEMVYAPPKAKKTIVLVGKGVTFDTGGYNLKSSSGLSTMKIDMGGAAAVAATMIAVAGLKPKSRVVGVTPLVENMVSGDATRPGDIIKSFSGKTVEIGNTDAEGRLILADAMAYAVKKYKPDTLIDLATLTGACLVALGEKMAAVFSKDQTLSDAIVASGRATHERCWPMPLPDDYKDLLKSELADISNQPSTRYGGAITAALFLSEFVGDTRWAHIDIAGPVFQKKGSDYCAPGGTGFGVRLLCDLIGKL